MGENIIIEKLTEHDGKFEAIDERFEAVDRRFDAVDRRFDAVDERFDGIDKRLDGIDEKLVEHDKRLDRNDEQHDLIIRKLIEHDHRFDHLEYKISQDIASFRNEILSVQDKIMGMLSRVETEIVSLVSWTRRTEKKCDKHAAAIEKNTTDITEIKRFLKMN